MCDWEHASIFWKICTGNLPAQDLLLFAEHVYGYILNESSHGAGRGVVRVKSSHGRRFHFELVDQPQDSDEDRYEIADNNINTAYFTCRQAPFFLDRF